MAKVIEVVLDGNTYAVAPITVGQLEELASLSNVSVGAEGKLMAGDGSPITSGLIYKNVLDKAHILLRNTTPKIENVRDIPCSMDEVVNAVAMLMKGTGLVKENPVGNDQAGE